MLNEYRKIYEDSANIIGDWKKEPIINLANNYLKFKDENNELYNSYFSAIVLRYWYTLQQNYVKDTYFVQEEDCYNWLIDAIMYVLQNHVWTNPDSSLYQDPQGPEKAINVCISGQRAKFYRYIKHDIRNANYTKVSLEQLKGDEENGDYDWALPLYYDDTEFSYDIFDNKIFEYFKRKEYFNAFALDCILNFDMFVNKDERGTILSNRKIKQKFRNFDEEYCTIFSNRYMINKDLVLSAIPYVNNITDDRFNRNMKYLREDLLNDKNIRIALNL